MTPVLWVLSLVCFALFAGVAGFLAGRGAGARASEAARAADRMEGERRRADDTQTLALLRAENTTLGRDRDRLSAENTTLRTELTTSAQSLSAARSALAAAEAESRTRAEHLSEKEARLLATEDQVASLQNELRRTSAALESSRKQIEIEGGETEKKLKLLADAEEKLGNQFKVLAADIFREKSQRFREENEVSLSGLLNPLKQRLGDFQQRVEALRDDGIKGREELKQQIGDLKDLNQQLSSEASNLVRALKGSSKTQGDWGEFVLEQMLENAGLRRDHEYRVQAGMAGAENSRARPDVILNLPGGRHLVIDAKVSLLDYSAHCDGVDDAARAASLGRHVGSVRSHIKELSGRNYPGLYQLESMDFVVMFVPIEPAFLLAIARDGALWQEAWDRNVLLVSPSTLLFVVRTVAHLWRQEKQRKNVQEIVDRGGELYDKFAAFAKDLIEVGSKLGDAQKAYDNAYSKLARGKGNAIRQVEMLRTLGVKPSKQIPRELTDAAQEDLLHELAASTDYSKRKAACFREME
jgi:DNA recombination protein RmuC